MRSRVARPGSGCLTVARSYLPSTAVKCGRDASESKMAAHKAWPPRWFLPAPPRRRRLPPPPSRQGPQTRYPFVFSLNLLPYLPLDTMYASIAVLTAALARSAHAASPGQPLVSNAPLGEFQTVGNSIASAQQVRSLCVIRPR